MGNFLRFFRDSREEEVAESREISRQAMEWIACLYHKRFLDWLDEEASKPIQISANQLSVVESAARSNTFREVKQYLTRLDRECRAVLAENRE